MERFFQVGTVVAIVSWIMTAVGLGKYVGKLKSQVQENSKKVEKLEKMFITEDGEQRLMSIKMYDKGQADCQKLQNERYDFLVKRMDEKDRMILDHLVRLDTSIIELTKQISCLTGLQKRK